MRRRVTGSGGSENVLVRRNYRVYRRREEGGNGTGDITVSLVKI